MSVELKNFLLKRGIAASRTTSYNPTGNGQVERLNGSLWKAITLALKTQGLPVNCWQEVLSDALHSIRSLSCTATNATPHERLFAFQRRSTSGISVPTWLTVPGPVLLKRHVRNSKYEPLVDEVELIEANPKYAHVKFPDGRVDTVSTKHLAPQGDVIEEQTDPLPILHRVKKSLIRILQGMNHSMSLSSRNNTMSLSSSNLYDARKEYAKHRIV